MHWFGFFIIFGISLRTGLSLKLSGKALEGGIKFPADKVPDNLEPGSCLTVKLDDVSLQDTSSTVIMRAVVKDLEKSYKKGESLKYKLEFPGDKDLDDKKDYSVSAVLNNGWCAKEDSNDWIKKGDFLTDTTNPVDIKRCSQGDCKVDMNLVKNRK